MEEMGVEVVQHWGPWVIVRRQAGLLVNSVALLGADHLPNTTRIAMAVVALFLILVGTFKTLPENADPKMLLI